MKPTIQALFLILAMVSPAFGEPVKPKEEAAPAVDAAAPSEVPAAKEIPAPEKKPAEEAPQAKIPVAKVLPAPQAEAKVAPKEDGEPKMDSEPKDSEPTEPKEKPKSLFEIRAETLQKFVNDEVQGAKLSQEKKTQLRAMAMAAYRDKQIKPLWSEAMPPPVGPVDLEAAKKKAPPTEAKPILPIPVDPTHLEKLTLMEKLLAAHKFEEITLSFHPQPRIANPECPVPLNDITMTLALAETCLRLKQGPEAVSEWPNWTFGDEPIAVSNEDYHNKLAERFGKVAAEASDPAQVAEEFVPKNWVYQRIIDHIRQEQEKPEPPNLEIEGLVKVDKEFPKVPELADFLHREGHLAEEELAAIDGIFTKPVSDALRAFQEQKNIQSDGILGPATARKIAQTNGDEAKQLLYNLHRARRLPDDMGEKYLLANLPSGELYGFENGEESIRMRVVFGKDRAGLHTPLFRDKMENVVFRPYWNVPYSISVNESNYRDPSYLSRNGFKIISNSGSTLPINYSSLDRVSQHKAYIRQNSGNSNALGLVKFLFPNPHAVYFHDTPSKQYFEKTYRAYSHGCVRIQKPEDMANWILKDSEDWDAGKIKYAINEGDRKPVDLEAHIPVYIAYFTAFPDPKKDSGVDFHRDYYDYDKPNAVVDAPGPKPRSRTNLSSSSSSGSKKKRSRYTKKRTRSSSRTKHPTPTTSRIGSLFDRIRAMQR